MRFDYPTVLQLLWLAPLALLLLALSHRQRRRRVARFIDPPMAKRLAPTASSLRVALKNTCVVAGLSMLVIAGARPRMGAFFEDVRSRGLDLVVMLDVSRSMLAEDVAPNRLARAKSDIEDLLPKLRGDRVGLIAFAGAPTLPCPLTTDTGFFRSALLDVDVDSAPRGGSMIGDAIRLALTTLDEKTDRDQVLLLITDGEDHESFPERAAQEAARREVKLIAVGMGDAAAGSKIPSADSDGTPFVQFAGQDVVSKLDARLLEKMAHLTGGAYIPAETRAYDLGAVYEQHLAHLTRGETAQERRKRYRDRFPFFLFLGIVLLVGEPFISPFPNRGGAREP